MPDHAKFGDRTDRSVTDLAEDGLRQLEAAAEPVVEAAIDIEDTDILPTHGSHSFSSDMAQAKLEVEYENLKLELADLRDRLSVLTTQAGHTVVAQARVLNRTAQAEMSRHLAATTIIASVAGYALGRVLRR